MARTPSTMLDLGTPAPAFRLPDPGGQVHGLEELAASPVLLVAFICNHCPYVKHLNRALVVFAREYLDRGLEIVAINSNDVSAYPEDGPARMKAVANSLEYPFPYLFDESQEVARAYRAACTPDFFLFDGAHRLAYHGQFDDSRPQNGKPITGRDLRAAADAVLAGRPAASPQATSIGCSIKWRPGNAPEYAG